MAKINEMKLNNLNYIKMSMNVHKVEKKGRKKN